jgi:hypothetical protein
MVENGMIVRNRSSVGEAVENTVIVANKKPEILF